MARLTLALAANNFARFGTTAVWAFSRHQRPEIGARFMAGDNPGYLGALTLTGDSGRIDVLVAADRSEGDSDVGPDFSAIMERHGRIEIAAGGQTLAFDLGNADATEPYTWRAAGVGAFVAGLATFGVAGTLTLDDRRENPRPAGLAFAAARPRAVAAARPLAAGFSIDAAAPGFATAAQARAAGLVLDAARPRAAANARPRPAGLALGAGRPRKAGAAARPRAAGATLGAAPVRARTQARPAPAGPALGAGRPRVAFRDAIPETTRIAIGSGAPRIPVAGGVPPRRPPPATAAERWRRAARALAPARALVWGLEITHADVAAPVRIVSDTRDHTAGGVTWTRLRFGARLAADSADAPPRAELWVDNVGAVVTDWVTAAGGGAGARARVVQLSADPADPAAASEIEWEQTLRVESMTIDRARVTARLGPPSARGRQAVTARHDPRRSPGLF